jgi:hypothetical protein
MAPLRDLLCEKCGNELKDVLMGTDEKVPCTVCGCEEMSVPPSLFGGYSIKGNNSASQRPKQAGSFRKGSK